MAKFETAKQRLARLQQNDISRPIQSDDEYKSLVAAVVEVKTFKKEWDEYTEPIRKATKAAHTAACAMFSDIDKPLDTIIERLSPILLHWERLKEAERVAAEKKMNEEIAQAADPTQPAVAPLVVALPKLTAPSGLTRRVTWSAEVVDLMELVKAVAKGKAPLAYLQADMKQLNTQATALKKEMKIPGVIAKENEGYAAKRG